MNVLDSKVRSVGSIVPKYVGAVRPKLAVVPKSICARKGCEINGENWSCVGVSGGLGRSDELNV
jgi:hypothetical protein